MKFILVGKESAGELNLFVIFRFDLDILRFSMRECNNFFGNYFTHLRRNFLYQQNKFVQILRFSAFLRLLFDKLLWAAIIAAEISKHNLENAINHLS